MPDAPSTAETLALLKHQARTTWSAGNYDAIADGIWEVGAAVVERAAIRDGEDVLDVACGTGNAAVRAALAGGSVTGVDLVPLMFEGARRRASEAGVDVRWVEGDAEALPFDDAAFDVVLSTFGVMFAPRHVVAAGEMARVLRPGGRIGLATWSAEGSVANLFETLERRLPPSPEVAQRPLLWGVDDYVRDLFEGTGITIGIERRRLRVDPDIEVSQATEFYLASFGPIVAARDLLEPQGRWEPLRAELGPAIERLMREPAEYLLIAGVKRG